MMISTAGGALACFALVALLTQMSVQSKQQHRFLADEGSNVGDKPTPFRAGYEYIFEYNGQLASGLMTSEDVQDKKLTGNNNYDGGESGANMAFTRLQAKAKFNFITDSRATLQLALPRLGQLNAHVHVDAKRVQPMGMFQSISITEAEKQRREQLTLPCDFVYTDGVVERVIFHPKDSVWSRNIKRAVLNMIQLNLEGKRSRQLPEMKSLDALNRYDGRKDYAKAFIVPETSVEGICLTTYTINNNAKHPKNVDSSFSDQFNVTKSIDFKNCRKIADVSYGYQLSMDEQSLKCQMNGYGEMEQQEVNIDESCDPKELNEDQLERSTVQRVECVSSSSDSRKSCGIKRAETLSHYVYRTLGSSSTYSSSHPFTAMHSIAVSELMFRGMKSSSSHFPLRVVNENSKIDVESSLLYDNEWETEEKRFYMYGDEQFRAESNPFRTVDKKAEQAKQIFRRIMEALIDKSSGIEGEITVQLQRLVELFRMCDVEELKGIERAVLADQKQQLHHSHVDAEKLHRLISDALALAGTRNTVHVLIQKINAGELSPVKAAHTLKSLYHVPAPSDSIVSMVSELCKTEIVHRSAPLRQSCWLTYGAMVGEMCRDQISAMSQNQEQLLENIEQQQNSKQQEMMFGTQSGFNRAQVCPPVKKNSYKQLLIKQLQEAESNYDKVLALKAIGNAGLDTMVFELEAIANGRTNDSPVVRTVAIDALRRLRKQMPRRIQRICLPIFENTKEASEIRMAAFTVLMISQPESVVLDQILYTLAKERCQQVKAFVYTSMKSLSESKIPREQIIAKHLKSALQLSGMDEEAAKRVSSANMELPILYNTMSSEGAILKLISTFTEKKTLPAHLAVGIDTVFNGKRKSDSIKLTLIQQGTNHWLENIVEAFYGPQTSSKMSGGTRASRSAATNVRRADEELREIFSSLSIRSRSQPQTYSNSPIQKAFAMFCVRADDVDSVILPLDEQTLSAPMRALLERGDRDPIISVIRQLAKSLETYHIRSLSAMNFNEKTAMVPTSAGIPLKIAESTPLLISLEASAEVLNKKDMKSFNNKVYINAHTIAAGVHMLKMESWTPFCVSGIASRRAIELNAPFQTQIESDKSNKSGIKFTWKVPEKVKTRLFGVHSLAIAYTNDKTTTSHRGNAPNPGQQKLRAIQIPMLEKAPVTEIDECYGEQYLGMPICISGHYHTPVQLNDWAKWIQLAMATENHVHVTLRPSTMEPSPRAVVVRASTALFEPANVAQMMDALGDITNFYDNAEKDFHPAYPKEYENMKMNSYTDRRQKLNKYIQKLTQKSEQIFYKHGIKLVIQTEGGRKNVRAQTSFNAICDARLKTCAMTSLIECTSLSARESEPWTWMSKAEYLMPETVSSVSELMRLGSSKQQSFLCNLKTEWGMSTSQKQSVHIRIQGNNVINFERLQKADSSKLESRANSAVSRQAQLASAFVNNYDCVCDYKLSSKAQNIFSRLLDVVKSRNFWNTVSNLQTSGRSGQIYAGLMIEPISARRVHLQVRTPTETVKINGLELPVQYRPISLIQVGEKTTHSIAQFLARITRESTRAQCEVEVGSVETFDGARYTGPITSSCYSVLAKDCANQEQPKFAVLMKSVSQDGYQKKIKVITPEHSIVCQANTEIFDSKKIVCEINGETVAEQHSSILSLDEESHETNSPIVEYNNEEQTSVWINIPSGDVSVRFGCHYADCQSQKAWIQLANKYKHTQCGLCGHYDGTLVDEMRMGNNEPTQELTEFHRSYSVLSSDNDVECTKYNLDNFYSANQKKFMFLNKNEMKNARMNNEDSDEGIASDNEEDESNKLPYYYGGYAQESESDEDIVTSMRNNGHFSKNIDAIDQTKVIEQMHQTCLSVEPVKQCPRGTIPASSNEDSALNYGENNTIKVNFACMPRFEAYAYLRVIHQQGGIVDFTHRKPNFSEEVQVPTKCRRF